MIFVFFGFVRYFEKFSYNIDITTEKDVYIFTPTIRNENLPEDKITIESIQKKYGESSNIVLYPYEKQKHIDKYLKLNVPRFNQFFQQPYRIFSFFYNIKTSLELVKNSKKYQEDDVILLSRIDIGLNINLDLLKQKIEEVDVIAGHTSAHYGTDDKWFVFKYKHIDVFISLYDSYESYLVEYYNQNKKQCGFTMPTTRPEDAIVYHFNKNKLKFVNTHGIIDYSFEHICSEYCGHNGLNSLE
jgi:hypothetical protein